MVTTPSRAFNAACPAERSAVYREAFLGCIWKTRGFCAVILDLFTGERESLHRELRRERSAKRVLELIFKCFILIGLPAGRVECA